MKASELTEEQLAALNWYVSGEMRRQILQCLDLRADPGMKADYLNMTEAEVLGLLIHLERAEHGKSQ